MKYSVVLAAAALALSACRGEPVPRDYQNNPPAMTHPVTSSQQTPTAKGLPNAAPEVSTGAEGKNITRQPTTATSPSTTLGDQAPAAAPPSTATR